MKELLLLLLVLVVSCKDIQKEKSKSEPINTVNFNWLLGEWQRTNEEPNMETFEYWKKANDSTFFGMGIRVQNKDTLFLEKMKLLKTKKDWNLKVITKEDDAPTVFKVINIAPNEFTCENPENEFPNKIHYFKEGDLLKAIISNEEMEILFQFKSIK